MGKGSNIRSEITLAKKKRKVLDNADRIRHFKKARGKDMTELEKGEERFHKLLERFDENDGDDARAPSSYRFSKKGGENGSEGNEEQDGDGEEAEGGKGLNQRLKKRKKEDPFVRAVRDAQKKREEAAAKRQDRIDRAAQHTANIQKRKERHKQHTKRSRRGQPLMNDKITSMLDTLKREIS